MKTLKISTCSYSCGHYLGNGTSSLTPAWARNLESICLSICLSVCPSHPHFTSFLSMPEDLCSPQKPLFSCSVYYHLWSSHLICQLNPQPCIPFSGVAVVWMWVCPSKVHVLKTWSPGWHHWELFWMFRDWDLRGGSSIIKNVPLKGGVHAGLGSPSLHHGWQDFCSLLCRVPQT